MVYVKPKLERFGTFRELTQVGLYSGGNDLLLQTDLLDNGS
jgi:hypothetical protein